MTDLLTHACRWNDCANCGEPRRCDCACHAGVRVWGRWT